MCGTLGTPTWARTRELMAIAQHRRQDAGPCGHRLVVRHSAVALYLNGRFRPALELADESERIFREQTAGMTWEITTTQLFSLQSLSVMGELRELARRTPRALREALDRGDLYAAVMFRVGHLNLAWLVGDDVAEARRHCAEAMRLWSKEGFHVEHYYELYALTNADLYAGDADAALARVTERMPVMQRSLVTRVQVIRVFASGLRARSALAVAERRPSRRRELVRLARADAARIDREATGYGTPLASLVRAGAARLEGDEDAACRLLERAAREADAADMKMHGFVARRALGRLVRGATGATLIGDAESAMRGETIRDVECFAAMIAPGFDG